MCVVSLQNPPEPTPFVFSNTMSYAIVIVGTFQKSHRLITASFGIKI